jgi:DNA primase
MSRKVVLALDADRAGINAMKKGAELMLIRGLDVKIAELPLGKDPADIIQEDPVTFKKIIGQSCHVIEFLLHVIKSEIKDERSFKLKVREEVLPFVLLLPNRIDQEHFVSKIAGFINSTTEAIRFELDRLRDQADAVLYENNSLPDTNTKKAVVNVNTASRAYLFLVASLPLLEEKVRSKLVSELESITKISDIDQPSESDLAGTTFKLEQQFANVTKSTMMEEIINKLNYLKTNLIRQRLSENKEKLSAIEAGEDQSQFIETLNNIKNYESMLREDPFLVDDFAT